MNARHSARSSATAHTCCSQITLCGKLFRPMGYEGTDNVHTEHSELPRVSTKGLKPMFSQTKGAQEPSRINEARAQHPGYQS